MNRIHRLTFAVVAACIALVVLPTSAFAISRDLVLDRGMVWVNHVNVDSKGKKTTGVPYSQSRWATEAGTLFSTSVTDASTQGYRTDCSGFASLCWNLRDSKGRPYSASTAEFGAKGSKKYFQITKAQLQPGDMILKSTVWGASSGHAIIFEGWVDSSQKQFWAMEQTSSSSHNGTIYHARTYGEAYYRPYRYTGLEDPFSDVEDSISAADQYRAAAAGAEAAFPASSSVDVTVPALVVASAKQWGDQISGASLAGAVGGPVLLTAATSLPASTTAEIKRLKPARVFVLGSTGTISDAVAKKISDLGPTVVRIKGTNRHQVAAALLKTVLAEDAASGHPATIAYLATGQGTADALAVSPILAKTGRPILYVDRDTMPGYVRTALNNSHIKHVIVLGPTSSVSRKQELALKKAHFTVERVGGADSYKASINIAWHALRLKVGFDWKSAGVASPASCGDALAWATGNGLTGKMVLLTPTKKLDSTVRANAAKFRKQIGKARVYGGSGSVSTAARKSLAQALRTGT